MLMWFTASLLFRNRRIEPEVQDLKGIALPDAFLSAVGEFLHSLHRFRLEEWEIPLLSELLQDFCRYAVARGAKAFEDCRYEHLLGFLEHRFWHGASKRRLKWEAKMLADFLRFLWRKAGRIEDPLNGEDLDEDLEWLDDWFEESIVLLQANEEEEAWQKAETLGKQLAAEYQREAERSTRWEFVGVLKVYEVLEETLQDGTELFARFLTAKEARKLLGAYQKGRRKGEREPKVGEG
jgi:ribosomal protein L22